MMSWEKPDLKEAHDFKIHVPLQPYSNLESHNQQTDFLQTSIEHSIPNGKGRLDQQRMTANQTVASGGRKLAH